MRPRLRTLALAGVVALGGLFVTGARDARAQVYINTPGLSLGLGTPYAGVYPSYGYVPAVPLVAAPVVPYTYGYSAYYPVRPYVVGRPAYYGGYRPYGSYYGPYRHGYRRW